ncbi:MAG: methyltransferase domain-containing protein [Pseudomonadota bacterium]
MSEKIFSFTERLLRDAGIVSGMRVLDIGCGSGDVSFLVAELVGDWGEVVGVDLEASTIALAKERANERNCSNVSFMQANLAELPAQSMEFDAVVGRRILMYLPDAAAVLRHIAALIKPGGLFIFQESDSTMLPGRIASMPLHDKVVSWMWQTVEREGADIHVGFHLPELLRSAGVIVDHVRAEPVIQGHSTHHPLHFIVRAMLPRIIRHGVATEKEIEIETLEQRLVAELPTDAVYISDFAFGVWGHKPSTDG